MKKKLEGAVASFAPPPPLMSANELQYVFCLFGMLKVLFQYQMKNGRGKLGTAKYTN